jgi:signal transduction histidine kinase
LADRINILKKEKESSQFQLIGMMEENQRLVNQQNTLLEKEVEARTRQLTYANHDLENTLHNLTNTQKQLVESEKLASLGQMTAGIAHEINNPVNYVRSNVQPLKRDIDELLSLIQFVHPDQTPQDLKQHWHDLQLKYKELDVDYLKKEIEMLMGGIEEGAKRTADIVRSLRIFSRTDQDELVVADINENIQSTLMVMRSVTSKEVKIITSLDETLKPVNCYPGKLNQVFMNLITNALHAVQESKNPLSERKIEISTKQLKDGVEIVFSDNGCGIPQAVREKIFDPFFTTKQVGVGTGLGLSIVLGIVQDHQGKINIDSTEHVGTRITIFLPK